MLSGCAALLAGLDIYICTEDTFYSGANSNDNVGKTNIESALAAVNW